MAFSQAQLDAIEDAIASGSMSVSYEGKSVTYRSLDDMLRVRAIIRSALGLTNPPATIFVEHNRGYSGDSYGDDD